MIRKTILIYGFIFAFCLVGCNTQNLHQVNLGSPTVSATNPVKPAITSTPAPTKTIPQTNTVTPSLTPTPDIWQIQECSNTPRAITLDSDWLWEYSGDFNQGQGHFELLLQFAGKNEIRGFAFDYATMQEYSINGCIEGRSFIMWLSEGDIVEAVVLGEFPEIDPRGHMTSELSGDIITGWLANKSKSGNSSIYLNLLSGSAGTMDHRFRIAGTTDDTVILKASQKFIQSIIDDDRNQVVSMIRFPLYAVFGGESLEIETPELFLEKYDDVFDAGFIERLENSFPNKLIAYAGKFLGIIGQSIYGGGGIHYDENGKVAAIYNRISPTPTPIPWLTATPTLTPVHTYTPVPTPTISPECGKVKFGTPGTQSQDDKYKVVVQGTAILCADGVVEFGRLVHITISEGVFDLDTGTTGISEKADIEFDVSGRTYLWYYLYPINEASGIDWSLLVVNEKVEYPPEPTFEDCYDLADTYEGENETAYLCVWTGSNNLARVKVEEWNPIDDRTLAVEISFITWDQ